MDGGVGLYDMGAKKWDFLRDLVTCNPTKDEVCSCGPVVQTGQLLSIYCFQGHVETIFDCKFKPDDANLLATASFDGTIKIWDTNTLTAVYTSPGNEGVVYSLSWAPGLSRTHINTRHYVIPSQYMMLMLMRFLLGV